MEERPETETANQRAEVACFPTASSRVVHSITNCQEATGAQLQPWRCFWPPASGSDAHKRLLTEHPEVLTWRFDIAQLFDRPWRLWTDSAPVEGEGSLACPFGPDQSPGFSLENGGPIASAVPQDTRRKRQELDAQLHHLNLQVVQPDSFHYLAPRQVYQAEKPYKCQLPKESFPSCQMHNLASESYRVAIANITSYEHLFSLAVSGFEFAKCPITVPDWSDHYVSSNYLPNLVDWLKGRLGCRDVFCYAYNFRHHGQAQTVDGDRKYDFKPPFFRAHCDATESTCQARLQLYFPDSYQQIMSGRVRFINVWRPISPAPVEDCPLALCDFRTVDRGDLVPMDIVYPHFVDEAYEVKYNPSHRWFYKKGMTQEDVIVFKLYDSLKSEATVCPHSAFVDPSAPLDTPRRSSIEVKAIVLG